MIQRLAAEQRDWRLLYAVRSRARAAYLDILLQRYPDRLSLHVDEEAGGVADLAGFLRTAPADAQLYCCGPTPMLDAFESATADRQPSQVHLERFKGSGDVAAGGFTVIAAASGGSHFVAEGSTILDTLLDAGLDIPHSCADGICGTCATRVIEGIGPSRHLAQRRRARGEQENADLRFRLQGQPAGARSVVPGQCGPTYQERTMSLWLNALGASVRFHDVNGVRTRCLEAGEGQAVLLLHGIGGHVEAFAKNVVPWRSAIASSPWTCWATA